MEVEPQERQQITGKMAEGNDTSTTPTRRKPTSEFPWCCTLLARILGVSTAVVMLLCGIVTLIPTGAFFGDFGSAGRCLAAGLLMILFAVCMLFIEAPFIAYCSPHLEWIIKLTSYIYSWMRGALYCLWAIVPILICASISSIIAQILLFFLGVFYFVLTIGGRGNRSAQSYTAKYHNNSGEIDMILKEDMEDSEDEELVVGNSTPKSS